MDPDPAAPVYETADIDVAAPAEAVWDSLTDVESWPRWMPGVKSVVTHGPFSVGSKFEWRAGPGVIRSEVMAAARPRLAAWKGRTMGTRSGPCLAHRCAGFGFESCSHRRVVARSAAPPDAGDDGQGGQERPRRRRPRAQGRSRAPLALLDLFRASPLLRRAMSPGGGGLASWAVGHADHG